MTHLCIQIKANPQVLRLKASSTDEESNQLVAKDDQGKVIGKFRMDEIVGWWMEAEPYL
jgi:hypothetical protein